MFGGWFGGGGEKIVHPSKQDPAENEAEDQVESTAQELQDEQLDSNLSDADEQSETAQDETFVTDTAAEQTDSQVSAEEDELGFFERLNNKYGVDETPTAANEDRN